MGSISRNVDSLQFIMLTLFNFPVEFFRSDRTAAFIIADYCAESASLVHVLAGGLILIIVL
jgi:hypothetical protein